MNFCTKGLFFIIEFCGKLPEKLLCTRFYCEIFYGEIKYKAVNNTKKIVKFTSRLRVSAATNIILIHRKW